jgi:hypothetical protein
MMAAWPFKIFMGISICSVAPLPFNMGQGRNAVQFPQGLVWLNFLIAVRANEDEF